MTLFGACQRNNSVLYAIQVADSNVVCAYAEQSVEVKYNVHENILNSDTKFSARSSEPWVTIEDTSNIGTIRLRVEENDGESRKAKITISAPGCVSTSFTLMQYRAPAAETNHTLMFYFFGTSLGRYFNTNTNDAIDAIDKGILGGNNRVLIFRQKSQNKAYISELCYDVEGYECIEHRIVDDIEIPSTTTPEDIASHIAQMAEIAPSKRYGIVFAGHGQGWITREIINQDHDISTFGAGYNPWIPAVGAEVTRAFGENNVQVNIVELAQGIEASNIKFDYLIFDACFMANIEALYDLRNTANYIIASPCEIMGNGFPYHRTLPYLFDNDGLTTDYDGAANSYHKYYKDEYTGSTRCGSITVFDCSQIEPLADATREVVKSAKKEYDTNGLQTYEGQHIHHFYDFGQWANTVATDSEAIDKFNAQMQRCIIATYTLPTFYSAYGSYGIFNIDLDVYTGVTTSAPSQAYPNGWRQTNWYKAVWELEN